MRNQNSTLDVLKTSVEMQKLLVTKVPPRHRWYREFTIPKKSGGERQIRAPIKIIKDIQKQILYWLAPFSNVSVVAHAYIRHRSIKSMATPHVGAKTLVKIDVKDFFPSITRKQVITCLSDLNAPPILQQLVSDYCFDWGHLPIGAPTSPLLSNLVFGRNIDYQIEFLCKHIFPKLLKYVAPVYYSRYADDLVFSTRGQYLPRIIPIIHKILKRNGFTRNTEKTIVSSNQATKYVCGVSVATKLGTNRRIRNSMRGWLTRLIWSQLACDGTEKGYYRPHKRPCLVEPIPIDEIKGRISFFKFLCPEQTTHIETLLNVVEHSHFGKDLSQEGHTWMTTRSLNQDQINSHSSSEILPTPENYPSHDT